MRRVRHRMDPGGYTAFDEYLDFLRAGSDESPLSSTHPGQRHFIFAAVLDHARASSSPGLQAKGRPACEDAVGAVSRVSGQGIAPIGEWMLARGGNCR